MGDSRIKEISALLSSFFDAEKLRRGEKYSDFFSSWAGIVGTRLAAHSRVADIDKGILIVEAEHPGWIQLLQLRQSSILEATEKRYPEFRLKGIAFRLIENRDTVKTIDPGEKTNGTAPESVEDEATDSDKLAQGQAAEVPINPEVKALFSELKKAMHGKSIE